MSVGWAIALVAAIVTWPPRRMAGLGSSSCLRPRALAMRRSDPEAECLEVLGALVTVLRAGSAVAPGLSVALDGVCRRPGYTQHGWAELRAVAAADGDVAELWRTLGATWRCSAFEDVAAAWAMSARHGCPLADALESASVSVRARRAHRASVDAASAGARASTGVLVGLPLLGIALGAALGVDVVASYRGAAGFVTLWPGLVLMAAGAWWSRRMIASALRPPVNGMAP